MYKMTSFAVLMLSLVAQSASALTVKEGDIVNKIREISLESVRLRGQPVTILADAKGLSVYTFDLDTPGNSNCRASCQKEWPPVPVAPEEALTAPFGKIAGNDGKAQLTLLGLPLYYYADDKKPGDVFGDYPQWHPVVVTK